MKRRPTTLGDVADALERAAAGDVAALDSVADALERDAESLHYCPECGRGCICARWEYDGTCECDCGGKT